MKKVVFALLLTFILTGLLGCKTSRATLKTDTKQELRQTAVTDSSSSEQATTTDRIKEALATSEQKNVVIEFEEWEYYPAPSDTATGGNYTQIFANSIRTGSEADKPPNAGSVKKRRKGTITINADRESQQTKEQATGTTTSRQVTANTETDTEATTKQKTASTETKGDNTFWILVGLICAALLVCAGVVLAYRRKT